jgi:hypothetical protein
LQLASLPPSAACVWLSSKSWSKTGIVGRLINQAATRTYHTLTPNLYSTIQLYPVSVVLYGAGERST